MSDSNQELREYVEKTTLELIEKYKNVIEKTFAIADKDLLGEVIDGEDEKDTERRMLEDLKKRRVSLDEVDLILEKIAKLEIRLNPELGKTEAIPNQQNNQRRNFTKEFASNGK